MARIGNDLALKLAESVGSLSFLQRSAGLALSGTGQVFQEIPP